MASILSEQETGLWAPLQNLPTFVRIVETVQKFDLVANLWKVKLEFFWVNPFLQDPGGHTVDPHSVPPAFPPVLPVNVRKAWLFLNQEAMETVSVRTILEALIKEDRTGWESLQSILRFYLPGGGFFAPLPIAQEDPEDVLTVPDGLF